MATDTIAACATGNALTAIGILRISGPGTIAALHGVFRPYHLDSMAEAPNRRLVYGELLDDDGSVLDICLCTVSRAPHSYTGEDTAELQCHGSPAVMEAGLRTLFRHGVRQALPGEFTKRAFLNGCMDLTQAEAVIDLIEAQTSEAAKNAASQLGRAITRETESIRSELTDIMAHFHAVLDYPDEDIDDFTMERYLKTMEDSRKKLSRLLGTFDRGSVLKNGVPCAVIGRPNTGKSSLMNALLGYDRAIVTDIPGTTRDTIEEKVRCGSVLLRLIDTAGIRETEDPVEKLGVSRSQQAADEARLVLAVLDSSKPLTPEDRDVIALAQKAENSLIILNKCDLPQGLSETDLPESCSGIVRVSALQGEGIETLCETIEALFPMGRESGAEVMLTNARQAEAVQRAVEGLNSAMEAAEMGITPDAVLTGVEDAIYALGELSGASVREDITHRIFSRFCVGK